MKEKTLLGLDNVSKWGCAQGQLLDIVLNRNDHTQQAKCATFKFQHSQVIKFCALISD